MFRDNMSWDNFSAKVITIKFLIFVEKYTCIQLNKVIIIYKNNYIIYEWSFLKPVEAYKIKKDRPRTLFPNSYIFKG